jgi:hypothetical protein
MRQATNMKKSAPHTAELFCAWLDSPVENYPALEKNGSDAMPTLRHHSYAPMTMSRSFRL